MGELDGKVASVTGAAQGQGQGQGRSHAVELAREGADVIAVDVCEQVPGMPYPTGSREELEETVRRVEALDRRIVAAEADVRDFDALAGAVGDGVAQLGRLDIVAANAGIGSLPHASHELPLDVWQQMIDVDLTGVWQTCKAAIPHILAGGRGGAIVLTSSAAGLQAHSHISHCVSAEHGVVGLMRTLAVEYGPERIRVNSIHPTQVETDMIMNDETMKVFVPDVPNPTRADFEPRSQARHTLPIPWVQPVDISRALVSLASDDARYTTGVPLPVDAGAPVK